MRRFNPAAVVILYTLLLAGYPSAGAGPSAIPEIALPLTAAPPVLDGVPDDACWTNAARAEGFRVLRDAKAEPVDVAGVKMTRDSQWLYLAFELINPTLKQAEFVVTRREDSVTRDECVEVYLDPGTEGRYYYQFYLTAHNIQAEQAGRDPSWFVPWRSATRKAADRWTAEVALPLSICAGYGDPAKARINFVYYRTNVGLDVYGARMGQDRVYYIWSPIVQSVHEPEQFGYLRGLGDAPMEAVFLPAVDHARVEPFVIKGDERYYTVAGLARNYSSVTGAVEVVVEEKAAASDKPVTVTETLKLDALVQAPFAVKMPVKEFSARTVRVRIQDAVSGEILADTGDLDTSALTLMAGVVASRNYYTSEPEGSVRCRLGLPEAEMAGVRLTVRNERGESVAKQAASGTRATGAFPLAGVPEGRHEYSLALESEAGALICETPFVFDKLAPRPGYEVKVDRFTHSLVKDGEPVFPFGIYMHYVTHLHEEIFKLMADAGFNLMFRTVQGHAMTESRAAEYMELARKYNLMVAEWYGLSNGGLDSEMFSSASATQGKSDADKEAMAREHYELIRPGVEREMKIFKQYPNFLMHKNFDEPNLGDAAGSAMRYRVSKYFHEHAVAVDPHRPVYTLYARYFTDNALAFTVQDVVCFDIYTYPGWGGWSFDPVKQMAKYTDELRAAAEEHHKAIIIAPSVQALDPNRCPLPLTAQDQRAQTYAAIIYGAKGLVYFSWGNLYASEMWATLSDLAREVKILGPALLAPEPEQEVIYNPGQCFDAMRLQFPMVHARLFRHPDGGYVLLAVSGEESPVKTEFALDGLDASAKVRRMFGDQTTFTVNDGRFTDEIESYGTRAYRIETGELGEPVHMTLSMQADESRRQPRIALRPEIVEIEKQKNYMPNPVFAKCRVYKEFPDFMRPVGPMLPNLGTPESGWFLDSEDKWNGRPSLCMRWIEPFEKIKHVATEGNPWNLGTEEYGVPNSSSLAFHGVHIVYYPRSVAEPTPQVFSFYAKGGKNGDKVGVHSYAFGSGKVFELTDTWKRFEFSGTFKPVGSWLPGETLLIRIYPGSTVWINGLQMEDGEAATEFSEQ